MLILPAQQCAPECCNRFCISCKRLDGLTSASVSYSFSVVRRNLKVLSSENLILRYFNVNFNKYWGWYFPGVNYSWFFNDSKNPNHPVLFTPWGKESEPRATFCISEVTCLIEGQIWSVIRELWRSLALHYFLLNWLKTYEKFALV